MAVTCSPAALWALYKVHILVLDHYSYLRYPIFCETHSVTREKFLFFLRQLLRLWNFWYVLE